MRKIVITMIITLLLSIVILLNISTEAYGHSIDLDFYDLFAHHKSVMLLIDAESGQIEHANQAAADFYGYTIEELESLNVQTIQTLPPEEIKEVMEKAVEEENNYFIFDHRLAGGEVRTVEVYSCPHFHGEKTLLFSTIHDITEKTELAAKNKKMTNMFMLVLFTAAFLLSLLSYLLFRNYRILKAHNHEISNFNELRKTFMDAHQSIIYLKDENLKYVFVNKALAEFYQKEADEIIGEEVFTFADEEFAEKSKYTDLQVLERKELIIDEVQWKGRVFQTTKFPVKMLNGTYGVGAYVKDVTEEYQNKKKLEEVHLALQENEIKLQIILDSTAEGIYGIDLNGNCTFCNASCLRILGYKDQEELLGKNMHWQIHHSRSDGNPLPIDECHIFEAFKKGQGVHVEDEVLWRSDGTCFDAEYYSYPQYREGELIGAVVTFMDITERKKAEKEIVYLSFHDALTGLYNRRFVEEELKRLDTERNLPLSLIMGDVNGLKLTNDIFGHAAGDLLLQKAAEALRKACRKEEIIARLGGDEFLIILPKTKNEEAEAIKSRIKKLFAKERIAVIRGSISMGCATKNSALEDLMHTMQAAEEKMYAEKTLDRKEISNSTIKEIIKTLHEKCPSEQDHAQRVSELCRKIGKAMNLDASELKKLEAAGFFHDIGKIVLQEDLLKKDTSLTDQEWQAMKEHPVVGYRILNSSEHTMELARYVLTHHERWDGGGYPKGLQGNAIPKLARIIALAEAYDLMINGAPYKKAMSKEEVLAEIKRNAGRQFDPEIVGFFLGILSEVC